MENEDYRIINKNDTTIKCFRDGRIVTLSKKCKKYEKWNERIVKPNNRGYIQIEIDRKLIKVHRLIMEAFEGPSEQEVDHIDRNKTNNNFHNLRYCTRSENNLNRDYCYNAKGCYWYKPTKKWKAQIRIDGKAKHLGYFEKEEDAHQAYLDASARRNLE